MNPTIQSFFDPVTGTISHVVYDRPGGQCAIVDPVLDYDPVSGRTSTNSADRLLSFVRDTSLAVAWILETHAHADHLTAAQYLRAQTGGRTGIGSRISVVQENFRKAFAWEEGEPADGSQFDHLFADGEEFAIGSLTARTLHVPGHTPASAAYQVGDNVFVGDLVFRPAMGSARCDFPGGDPRELYRSARRILSLPASTKLYLCHDYPAQNDTALIVSTVEEQRRQNVHLHDGVEEEEFVALRNARDANLPLPNLILPSIQVNIRGGRLPAAQKNGVRYIQVPLDVF